MIVFNGKNHTSIYYNGKYHNKVYLGSKLVWTKGVSNLYDATVTDIDGYMRYADHKFNFTEGSTDYSSNAVTYFEAEPSTTYTVTMNMDTRFRLWSCAGMPTSSDLVIANYAIHATDDNTSTSQSGASKTLTITTASTDTRVFIGYWSKGGSVARLDVRNSITAVVGGVDTIIFNQNLALDSEGNITDREGTLLTNFIAINNSTSVTYYGMTACLAEYDKDKLWLDYWNAVRGGSVDHSNEAKTSALTGGVNTKFMRFCVLPAKQGICYLYDNTNAKYLYKGPLVIW